jgi:hypothetical protein
MRDTPLNIGDIVRYYKSNYYGTIIGVDKNIPNHIRYYVDWFDAINPVSYRETQLVKVSS